MASSGLKKMFFLNIIVNTKRTLGVFVMICFKLLNKNMFCSGRGNCQHADHGRCLSHVECLMFLNYHRGNRCFVTKCQNVMWLFYYLSLSFGELTKTASHMCDNWYLIMCLLRNGSLILMTVTYLIDLARFCFSLPTMLKLSTLVV